MECLNFNYKKAKRLAYCPHCKKMVSVFSIVIRNKRVDCYDKHTNSFFPCINTGEQVQK
jgi:hypothetical protein